MIGGGRTSVRNVLYMGRLVAIRTTRRPGHLPAPRQPRQTKKGRHHRLPPPAPNNPQRNRPNQITMENRLTRRQSLTSASRRHNFRCWSPWGIAPVASSPPETARSDHRGRRRSIRSFRDRRGRGPCLLDAMQAESPPAGQWTCGWRAPRRGCPRGQVERALRVKRTVSPNAAHG